MKSTASRRSASVWRSALFSTKISAPIRRAISWTRASSSPEIGGSAPSTTSAASIWGMNARVAAVLTSDTEPIPGVSTRHIPDSSSPLGTKTSTPVPFAFPGFRSSET